MSFTVEDFHDLVRLLEERPEWRREMRRLVLTDELLSLPEQIAELRTHTEQRFQELAAAQRRTEEQISTLSVQVTELAAAQRRTEERVSTLSTQLSTLVEVVQTLSTDVAELKGKSLEAEYRSKVSAYFGRLVRRVHLLSQDELATLLEDAVDRGELSEDQLEDVVLADVIVRGKRRGDGADVFLVVEVSWGVGLHDVERAVRRAALLAQIGTPAWPVVAGKWITPDAAQMARASRVWQVTDGRAVPPE
jgi:hypothetical protein